MDNVRKKILEGAIRHFGPGRQNLKAIEELGELIQALARGEDPANIAEEMADVRIMLDQLELIFVNHEQVKSYELRKLRRLDKLVHAADKVG